jgi:NADPH:quinone reductase-like Zn-dependent oxidoreductase
VKKPDNISFEQASAVNIAAKTALQALRDAGRLRPGQKVLINGASGGVGTFAVQIARHLGGEVTGVSSGHNTELVRSLGRRPHYRLHSARLHPGRRTVRPDHRQRREPPARGEPARAEAGRAAT